jgi:nicotinamidase-related amidase
MMVDFMNPFDFPGSEKLQRRAVRAARNAAALKARAQAQRIPCIYANDNFGNWTSEFSALTRGLIAKGGTSGEIARLLEPAKDDLSILKPRHSAFYETPLEFLLEDLGIARLIITGIAVDICVLATAQDAHIRKLALWIPADCVATTEARYERLALSHMARTMQADIRPARRIARI